MNSILSKDNRKQSMRDVYASTLKELIEKDDKVMVLDADLAGSSGTAKLFKEYPNNCVNCGIAEANMIGVATGMSAVGLIPYTHSFSAFITRKVIDQIYQSAAYSDLGVHMFGTDVGIWSQKNGGTHNTFSDLAQIRSIPNVKVMVPCDGNQFAWILKDYYKTRGVYYTRAPRKNEIADIYDKDMQFACGKGYTLAQGKDACIIAIGVMVHEALKVKEQLAKEGIDIGVIDLFSVKPYDSDLIQEAIKKYDVICVAENHSKIGGIGDIVASEIVKSKKAVKMLHIGVDDQFCGIGTLDYLKEKFALDANSIANKIKELL